MCKQFPTFWFWCGIFFYNFVRFTFHNMRATCLWAFTVFLFWNFCTSAENLCFALCLAISIDIFVRLFHRVGHKWQLIIASPTITRTKNSPIWLQLNEPPWLARINMFTVIFDMMSCDISRAPFTVHRSPFIPQTLKSIFNWTLTRIHVLNDMRRIKYHINSQNDI